MLEVALLVGIVDLHVTNGFVRPRSTGRGCEHPAPAPQRRK